MAVKLPLSPQSTKWCNQRGSPADQPGPQATSQSESASVDKATGGFKDQALTPGQAAAWWVTSMVVRVCKGTEPVWDGKHVWVKQLLGLPCKANRMPVRTGPRDMGTTAITVMEGEEVADSGKSPIHTHCQGGLRQRSSCLGQSGRAEASFHQS